MPAVSVCIPVYGVEKYIEKCARSLFEQTLESIEYIFVDDSSPDGSIAVLERVLEEYQHRREQVRIIRHEVNQGLVAARNHAVAACTGDYIIHCDPDDWVHTDMYEAMYRKAVETDADMVYCDYTKASENNNKYVTHNGACDKFPLIEEIIRGKTPGFLWNKLVKRSVAQNPEIYCPHNIIMAEDLLRVCQMLNFCDRISYLKKGYCFYRIHSGQTTKKWKWDHDKCLKYMEIFSILEKFFGSRYDYLIDYRKRRMLFSMLKKRQIPAMETYEFLSSCKTSLWSDRDFSLRKKIIFICYSVMYRLSPGRFICKP